MDCPKTKLAAIHRGRCLLVEVNDHRLGSRGFLGTRSVQIHAATVAMNSRIHMDPSGMARNVTPMARPKPSTPRSNRPESGSSSSSPPLSALVPLTPLVPDGRHRERLPAKEEPGTLLLTLRLIQVYATFPPT